MNKLLCSVCALCLMTALLTGCAGTGAPESTASPGPSAPPAAQTADPATPTASPESDLTGTIQSKGGVFLIDKDLFASQLDLVLRSFGYRPLPNPEETTGEKTGPSGEMVRYERYKVGSDVVLTLCADKHDGSLAEVVLTVSGSLGEKSFSNYQKCCVDMIDFESSKTILGALGSSGAGTTAVYSKNALYIQRANGSVTIFQIIPRN